LTGVWRARLLRASARSGLRRPEIY
jgi:hypothetical protein